MGKIKRTHEELVADTISYTSNENGGFSTDQYARARMHSIAQSMQAMAKNHVQLIKERDHYEQAYLRKVSECNGLERTITSLKGAGTRYRNKIEQLKDEIRKETSENLRLSFAIAEAISWWEDGTNDPVDYITESDQVRVKNILKKAIGRLSGEEAPDA